MATEQDPQEFDLERTDRLPILAGAELGDEFGDDAVPMKDSDRRAVSADENDTQRGLTAIRPEHSIAGKSASDFIRPSAFDLPSLAESVRTVEERIARQQAEYESVSRNYERSRDAELAAVGRITLLERELATVRSSLEAELGRVRELDRNLAERGSQAESARARAEEASRESERNQSEARTLRDSLATRDATIAQVLHSLGERDAQLSSLQQAHAGLQSTLELRGKSHSQIEGELTAAKNRGDDLSQRLSISEQSAVSLTERVKRTETELKVLRGELGTTKNVSVAYLEQLRTREFKRGFDENLFRELDARVGKADVVEGGLKAERDRLQAELNAHQVSLSSQGEALKGLKAALAEKETSAAGQTQQLTQTETERAELAKRLTALEAERDSLKKELAERTAALTDARAAATGDVQRISEQLASAEQKYADQLSALSQLKSEHSEQLASLEAKHAAQFTELKDEHTRRLAELEEANSSGLSQLQKEHEERLSQEKARLSTEVDDLKKLLEAQDEEMTVLMAHLKEARRPLEPIQADVRRLTEELSVRIKAHEALAADAAELRANLDHTKGALEEREFLIRRLERAESNNANVLGRIQTSMERLGSAPIVSAQLPPAAPQGEWAPELLRIDGDKQVAHVLARRTRIGRAQGCELQIDSTSVSRHHALIVTGPRETVVEDLNSTNGVIVNGRKVSRAFLNDGDTIIVGEVHFKFVAKLKPAAENLEASKG